MIQANELRIGNYVDSMSVLDKEIEIGMIQIESVSIKDTYEDYEPIPLTEEWLLKFGFEKNKLKLFGDTFIELDKFGFEKDKLLDKDDGYNVFIRQVDEDWLRVRNHLILLSLPCQYVHQLQNLYFTLTGKEIELKKETV